MVTLRVSMPVYLFNGREPTMNHDKMMNAIHEIFDPALPRLAPGDDAVTRRALDLLFNGGLGRLSSDFRVLDVGCGNGSQTLCLARELGCRVTALDNHQPYLDELQRRAQAEELSHLIQLVCADMNTLGDGEGEYDLVWAEGSAFVMGISQALRAWRTQLVPGGALGFTDLVWLQDEAPAACRDFFAGICPDMPHADAVKQTVADCGYELVDTFTLPGHAWWENFYVHLKERLVGFQPAEDCEESRAMLEMAHGEIENYRKHSDWFGYVFYLMRRAD